MCEQGCANTKCLAGDESPRECNPVDTGKEMKDLEILNKVIYNWEHNHYDSDEAGDYSATELIDPPRIVQLKKRHADDLELPIESKINAFFGSAVHDMYEKSLQGDPDYELETRVKVKINNRLITGKFDILYQKQHITDIKTTRVWKTIFDPQLKDWHEQQNIYSLLLRLNGYEISSINIIAHYYDWVQNMALRDKSYPRASVIEYSLSLWESSVVDKFLSNRVELHKTCENIPDNDLPECSPEDRWERLSNGRTVQYALLKTPDAKRAAKLFDDFDEAVNYGRTTKGFSQDSLIEIRHAQRKRCELYCSVAKYCNHYQEYLYKKNNGKLNEYVPLY